MRKESRQSQERGGRIQQSGECFEMRSTKVIAFFKNTTPLKTGEAEPLGTTVRFKPTTLKKTIQPLLALKIGRRSKRLWKREKKKEKSVMVELKSTKIDI